MKLRAAHLAATALATSISLFSLFLAPTNAYADSTNSTAVEPTTTFSAPNDAGVKVEIYNSEPWVPTSGDDIVILKKYNSLINNATGSVRLSLYNWGNNDKLPDSADRLSTTIAAARSRGVDLRAIANGTNYNLPDYVPAGLVNAMLADGTYHVCNTPTGVPNTNAQTSCEANSIVAGDGEGSGSTMHAKFATFQNSTDATGTSWQWVSLITSANHASSNWDNSNNAVVVYGDKALYDALNAWWDSMNSETDTGNLSVGTQATTLYTSPWSGSDPVAGRLDAFTKYSTTGGCQVYVTENEFNNSRVAVADQLVKLHDDRDCTIKVLVSVIGSTIKSKLAGKASIIVATENIVHDKSILIKAATNSSHDPRYFFFAGSQNLNESGWKWDEETFLKVELTASAYAALRSQFGDHWVHEHGSWG
ncbi:MAG: phospholipase D-like domain-containing protein [Propionicimonas sp.]|uniref:phospholipase D-like domain-containing protein n=1 Tax=Propionicimonas sp. TaxID=1955623 RepID=UPI003D110377